MSDFKTWWHETGSGIIPLSNHDQEEHAERVAQRAWDAASDPIDQMLVETSIDAKDLAYWRAACKRLISEKNKAIRERDEARREVCKSEQYCVDRSREEATRRGWDCFKKDNHNA